MQDKFIRETFIKDSIDLKAPDLVNWDMVAVSSMFREEIKDDETEKEVIKGYANAVNCITESIKNQNHPNGVIMALPSNSLIIPFIFLVRHTNELILKYLRKVLRLNTPNKHGLVNLWQEIKATVSKADINVADVLEDLDVYIMALEELDPDGSHARYSKSTTGELYHNKPKLINVSAFNNVLQKALLPLIDCTFI